MFLPDKQRIAIVAGFAVLTGVAIAGWTRYAERQATPLMAAQQTGGLTANPMPAQPVSAPAQYPANYTAPQDSDTRAGSNGGSLAAEPDYGAGWSTDGYYASVDQPVIVRAAEPPAPARSPAPAQYDDETAYYAPHHVHRRRHHRSLAKSIAIVAGSAGAGAAIGAIAGGGPGAAIGAIAGGSGGFIYDRSTAHH